MPVAALGVGAYMRLNAFEPEIELVNFFLEEDKTKQSPDGFFRIQRPGLTRFATLQSPARALFRADGVFEGELFAVAAGEFFTVENSTITPIGSVSANGRASIEWAGTALFVMSGGALHRWDGDDFITVTIPDDRKVADVANIDGFLIVACTDGRVYWIDPGASVIDPLDFVTAESEPDGLVAVRVMGGEFYLFGKSTVEPWQPTGDSFAPFQRAGGRLYQRGCISAASVLEFDNSLFWVGDDQVVYRAGAVPERVSDHGLEERLRKREGDPTAWQLWVDGHKFYVLRIPGQGTFALSAATRQWSRFKSDNNIHWRANIGISDALGTIASDSDSGAIWSVAPQYATDEGQAFQRWATASIATVGRPARNDSASILVGAAEACDIHLSWREGLDEFGPDEVLQIDAGTSVQSLYRLGMPDQPSRTFKISVSDPVLVRLSALLLNEAWQ